MIYSRKNLIEFLIAISNAWYYYYKYRGICILVIMLGYGLVALPKKLWKLPDYKLQTQYLEWRASEISETLEEHITELVRLRSMIKYYRSIIGNDIESQIILDKIWHEVINNDNSLTISLIIRTIY